MRRGGGASRRGGGARAARGAVLALGLLALALPCPGCVRRLLQVRSEPPGAMVYLNGEPAGPTPLDQPFTFYGTFDVTLRAPGYRSLHLEERVAPPWYEIFPLDLVSEHLLPWTIEDRRELSYRLEPLPAAAGLDRAQLDRAKEEVLGGLRSLQGQLDAAGSRAEATAEPGTGPAGERKAEPATEPAEPKTGEAGGEPGKER